MCRYAVIRSFIVAIVAWEGLLATPAIAQDASPMASPIAGTSSGCTVWRTAMPGPVIGPEGCTQSDPWWTSWSSCEITPVHSEPYPDSTGGNAIFAILPWVQAENANAVIVGHQWYGNRPLHVGGKFPAESMNAKVLWQFAEPVRDLTITGTDLSDASATPVSIVTGPANTSPASTQWPSLLSIPVSGCWRVDLAATDVDGNPVTGSVTYIVVD